MTQQEKPCAVIYDGSQEGIYRFQAEVACRSAGWIALSCTKPDLALEELKLGSSALVASLIGDLSRERFTGRELLVSSKDSGTPYAIITANSSADLWIREGESDLIIRKRDIAQIPRTLAEWLVLIANRSNPSKV